ncbi:hypothetical protein AWM79_04525 [Pseudomonas agarici]|uniref:Uncharacterized protein n=1 Tax=Pseudomonas agarici TaxID=46677 RepID=A0A0X1SXM6_PSEAA|nr:hypothetical protein [Pseudomonas agarici]AMB84614.1 hypothetical protein AWM79_04525 [Pseudomonas agarici]NWB92638.1 hypothetical protein [Pseudomonas agarici]NWC07534.1 hypothetical protein [Pseudomonas agarici]SEL07858.1 hypothetical protein SAMN05216604_110145 [Pseudomonas agarici]
MKTLVNLNFLRIPMNLLYDLDEVESFTGLTPKQVALLTQEYSVEELKGIRQALAYAIQHPEHDFKAMLPDLPQSNAEIAKVLKQICLSMPE